MPDPMYEPGELEKQQGDPRSFRCHLCGGTKLMRRVVAAGTTRSETHICPKCDHLASWPTRSSHG